MKKSLMTIAKFNGYKAEENEFDFASNEDESKNGNNSSSLLQAFKDPIYATNIAIM